MHLLLLLVIVLSIETYSQISPGDLTRAHASLEGISNCTSCHEIGEKVRNSNCLGCHTEISELVRNGRGYHSSAEVKGKNCSDCHSEHHGRNFRIVNFDPDRFDHSKTTFLLTGAHQKLKCADCHDRKNIVSPDAKKKKSDWVGLSSTCSACHTDYHQGSLGTKCESCHNTEKFRPSIYNHDNSRFVLTGAHKTTECVRCHIKEQKGGKELQSFTGLKFSSCENCHKDPHLGRFGKECIKCHSTSSFKSINQKNFDHSKTNFPLLGKHSTISCSQCHKTSSAGKMKHGNCSDCHSDYHKGEFITAVPGKDCRECHTENSFSPSLFSIERHNTGIFPLTGSHLAVTCTECHYKNNSWSFRKIGFRCADCHKNVHYPEIQEALLTSGGCENCHVTQNWHTISFDHNKTDFILAGRHLQLPCRNCHIPGNDLSSQRFASITSFCSGCHEDVHQGQFGSGSSEECGRCHSPENWKPEKFDHSKTRFSLEGAHSRLKCTECHKPVVSGGRTYLKYKLDNFKCASCHS